MSSTIKIVVVVEIAKTDLKSLEIFEYPSKIQTLVTPQLVLNQMVIKSANTTTREKLQRISNLCGNHRRTNFPCRSHKHPSDLPKLA